MSERIGRKRMRVLLDDVVRGEDLGSIARRHRMSREALSRWLCRPEHAERLATLARAADLQVEACVSQYRMTAAARLVELASAREAQRGDETIRRACNDVLKPRSATGDAIGEEDDELTPRQIVEAIEAAQVAAAEDDR